MSRNESNIEWAYFLCDACGTGFRVPAKTPPSCRMGHEKQPMRQVDEEEYHEAHPRRDPRRSED